MDQTLKFCSAGPSTPSLRKALDEVCSKLDKRAWGKDWEKIQVRNSGKDSGQGTLESPAQTLLSQPAIPRSLA